MIISNNNIFLLQTKNSSYFFTGAAFRPCGAYLVGKSILSEGQYEELLKGKKEDAEILSQMAEAMGIKHLHEGGNMIVYSPDTYPLCLEVMPLEMSSFGKGDIREPLIEVSHADGSRTSDFLFDKAEISDEISALSTLPSSYDDGYSGKNCQGGGDSWDKSSAACYYTKDKEYNLRLEIIYKVYPECDTITKSTVLYNDSSDEGDN